MSKQTKDSMTNMESLPDSQDVELGHVYTHKQLEWTKDPSAKHWVALVVNAITIKVDTSMMAKQNSRSMDFITNMRQNTPATLLLGNGLSVLYYPNTKCVTFEADLIDSCLDVELPLSHQLIEALRIMDDLAYVHPDVYYPFSRVH